MEAVDEVHVVAPPSYDKLQDVVSPVVAKGKRTKRQRLPLPLTITTTNGNNQNNRLSPSSSAAGANSSEEESTTTEEEDTARCLILLARGGNFQTHPLNNAAADDDDDDDDHRYDYYSKQNNSRKRPRKAGGGACMYACKTCDRVFPSFQALGGHRASHKKPRNEKIKTVIFLPDEEEYHHQSQKRLPPTSLSLQLSNISSAAAAAKTFPSPRTHECSYCRAEFASGQALGGHMRRHRPIMSLSSSNRVAAAVASVEEPESEEWKKRRNGLSLDLNLPAPEKLVISTAASGTLVDCHF